MVGAETREVAYSQPQKLHTSSGPLLLPRGQPDSQTQTEIYKDLTVLDCLFSGVTDQPRRNQAAFLFCRPATETYVSVAG